MKKTLAEMKKASEKLFQGEVTISKKDCWLIGAILVLAGIAFGFIYAPLTHGVNISLFSSNGSNNGNNCGSNNGDNAKSMADDVQDAAKEELCKLKSTSKPERIADKKNKRKKDKCCKRGMKGVRH